jgi:hypothetical protein
MHRLTQGFGGRQLVTPTTKVVWKAFENISVANHTICHMASDKILLYRARVLKFAKSSRKLKPR